MARGDNAFDLINSRSCFLTYIIIVVNFERVIFSIYMCIYIVWLFLEFSRWYIGDTWVWGMAIKLDRNACDKIRPIDSQACHLLTRALTKTGRDPGKWTKRDKIRNETKTSLTIHGPWFELRETRLFLVEKKKKKRKVIEIKSCREPITLRYNSILH